MRLKVGQGRPEPSILQGHRPDTTLFSTLQGLQMQSGVTVSALRRLVLKELTDKARGVPLQRASDGLRAVQNAWRRQHRPAHFGRTTADRASTDGAWRLLG